MRPRVEPGRFEMTTYVGHDSGGLSGQRHGRVGHLAIDVVHAEPDSFEVKRGHRALKRFRLGNEGGEVILCGRVA